MVHFPWASLGSVNSGSYCLWSVCGGGECYRWFGPGWGVGRGVSLEVGELVDELIEECYLFEWRSITGGLILAGKKVNKCFLRLMS